MRTGGLQDCWTSSPRFFFWLLWRERPRANFLYGKSRRGGRDRLPSRVPPVRRSASSPSAGLPGTSPQAPAATAHPAICRITVPERDGVSYGSGTLIDARGKFGLVVTNWHVVRDAAGAIQVEFPDGSKSPAEVVRTDKDWDLAALSIFRPAAEPLPVTEVAPQKGDWLTIAGYGSGDYRQASGVCTQYLSPSNDLPYELIELATEARQGDSGGPILNQRGRDMRSSAWLGARVHDGQLWRPRAAVPRHGGTGRNSR